MREACQYQVEGIIAMFRGSVKGSTSTGVLVE